MMMDDCQICGEEGLCYGPPPHVHLPCVLAKGSSPKLGIDARKIKFHNPRDHYTRAIVQVDLRERLHPAVFDTHYGQPLIQMPGADREGRLKSGKVVSREGLTA